MKPVLLDEIEARIPDIGRIRSGYQEERQKKNGTGTYSASVQSRTWILSAQTTEHLETLQGDYGGRIEPWEDKNTPDKFRLWTETENLHVVLHPGSLPSPSYQRWGGGRLLRRCNGQTCQAWPSDMGAALDGWERKFPGVPKPEPTDRSVEIPCVCHDIDDEKQQCAPKQHLGVILPQTPIGQWRLVTSSMNAVRELKASVEIVKLAAAVALPRAVLTRVDRIRVDQNGEKHHFRVPVVTTGATFEQIEAAAVARGALPGGGQGTPVALPTSAPPMALPPGAVTTSVDSEFGGEVDEMGPAPRGADVIELRPQEPEPEPEPEEVQAVELTPEEEQEARDLIAQMKAAKPKPVKKAAKKATRAPRKAAKKSGAKKATKRAKKASKPAEAQSDPEAARLRDSIRHAYLNMVDPDTGAAEALLAQADLWPIESIPDARAQEAAEVLLPVIDAAVKAGRLEIPYEENTP